MEVLSMIFPNRVLNLAILSWFVAQGLKVLTNYCLHRDWNIKMILSSGGMPSSHASFVTTCAVAIGRIYGFESPIFAIAAVFAFIVMYDAFNVRRAAGEQAKRLNFLMENLVTHKPQEYVKELKTLIGHTPMQVLAGFILGILIGLI